MGSELARQLADRAARAGLAVADPLKAQLLTYYELLARWNRKINLTSLSHTDAAIDRLLLEPLVAAKALPHGSDLMDLGSGGGSPAIPLALALRAPSLVMVESRARKAAFLREACRVLGVNAVVETDRFEALTTRPEYRGTRNLVSIRAVRMDELSLTTAAQFLRPSGVLALFVAERAGITAPTGFSRQHAIPLLPGAGLLILQKGDVPRETSRG